MISESSLDEFIKIRLNEGVVYKSRQEARTQAEFLVRFFKHLGASESLAQSAYKPTAAQKDESSREAA